MKKIALFSFLLFSMSLAMSQTEKKVELSSLSLSSGQGALSAGLFFEAGFTRGDDIIGMYLGERDLCVYYLKSTLNTKLHIGPMIEYYQNAPTIGGMAIASPTKWLSTTSWFGFSAGDYGKKVELANWQFLFFWQQADVTVWRFTASGIIMNFEGWHQMLDFKYKQPVTKHFTLFTSAGYDFFQDGKFLGKIGITYIP